MKLSSLLFISLLFVYSSFGSALTHFNLVDAQSNLYLYSLSNPDTIVLANTPIISIAAEVNAPVTKVEFYLDGVFIKSEK